MSRRRKDFTSLLRNIERPAEKGTYMGVASSIAGDGKNVHGQNFSEGEVRDLFFALPYGISSSGIDGIRVQIIRNDNQNNVAVGVIDKDKPDVKSGCIIIYDKSGSQIKLNGDGTMQLKVGKSGPSIMLNNNDGSINIKAKTININADAIVNINGSKINIG